MISQSQRGKDKEITQQSFDLFLVALDPDRERAGQRYGQIYQTLLKFFEWSSSPFPDEQADETINRVCRKLEEGEEIRDLGNYCKGVARFVHLNYLQSPKSKQTDLEEIMPFRAAPERDDDEGDPRLDCFESCLGKLPADARELITEYYQEDKRAKIDHRKGLADRLGIPLNALRIRSCRIRSKLEECVDGCMKKSAGH